MSDYQLQEEQETWDAIVANDRPRSVVSSQPYEGGEARSVVFPLSLVIDAPLDSGIVAEVAEEALQAFFRVVCERLDDYYPDGKTSGDIDPLYSAYVDNLALGWVLGHALNHPTVAAANPSQ